MMRSAGFRFLIVGLLALFMFIPLFFVGAVIDSRADYSRQTITDVGEEWGGSQLISGPVLVIPVEGPVTRTETRDIVDPATGTVRQDTVEVMEIRAKSPLYVLPEQLGITLGTETAVRSRGIFNVPVFTAQTDMAFRFDLSDVAGLLSDGERALYTAAEVRLSLSSNRALRGAASLTRDGTPLKLEPVSGNRRYGGIFAFVGDPRGAGAFALSFGLNGAEQVQVTPMGRNTEVTIASDWPHPSFFGAFLPDGSEVTDQGFTALWSIPHLARALPQTAREDYDSIARDTTGFGVRFFQPNDFYQKAFRAARYGILFIALTFLTVLLIENRTQRPTHPVQYILIGLAQSIFVLLMVAYAEQIGFGPAYFLSSGATIALLTLFGATALKLGKRTSVLGVLLVMLYGVLYLILRSADYALLAGATLAFVALGGTMILTRNEDWYGPPKTEGKRRRGLFGGSELEEGDADLPDAHPADPS